MAAGSRPKIPRPLLVEIFAVANLAFLTLDVLIAHSVNAFESPVEWVPVAFSAGAALLLAAALAASRFDTRRLPVRWTGYLVGGLGVLVGVTGLILHLRSAFFEELTLKSLVYTAPFAAPLSFAGLGMLLLMNRRVARGSVEWGQWVLFLAWAGYVGNFVLSLADHAQNGFFNSWEWLPVIASAVAIGFLLLAVFHPGDRRLLRWCWWVLGAEVAVGLLGFYFHAHADLNGPTPSLRSDLLFGAPVFAPLLFADLAGLAAIGLWDLRARAAVLAATERPRIVAGPGRSSIRQEAPHDRFAVRRVNEEAFGRPDEAELVDSLRRRGAVVLSLVAVEGTEVVGYILFSPVTVSAKSGEIEALGLGPMAVLPAYQSRGIGGRLVAAGLDACRRRGARAVVVLGNPDFYGRFGFEPASRHGMRSEFAVPDEVFMAQELEPGALGGASGVVRYQPEFNQV